MEINGLIPTCVTVSWRTVPGSFIPHGTLKDWAPSGWTMPYIYLIGAKSALPWSPGSCTPGPLVHLHSAVPERHCESQVHAKGLGQCVGLIKCSVSVTGDDGGASAAWPVGSVVTVPHGWWLLPCCRTPMESQSPCKPWGCSPEFHSTLWKHLCPQFSQMTGTQLVAWFAISLQEYNFQKSNLQL